MKHRYIVCAWVCEYGIYDTELKKFIGNPMSYNEAFIVLQWLLSLKHNENLFIK